MEFGDQPVSISEGRQKFALIRAYLDNIIDYNLTIRLMKTNLATFIICEETTTDCCQTTNCGQKIVGVYAKN